MDRGIRRIAGGRLWVLFALGSGALPGWAPELRAGPEPSVAVLDNGLRVIVAPRPSRSMAAVVASIHAGSAAEDPLLPGLAHLVEQMVVLHGSELVSGEEFAADLAAHGICVNGRTSPDWTTIELSAPVEKLDILLDRAREMLFHAAFPSEALARERDAVRREQLASDENPWEQAFRLAQRVLFADHPYGRDVLGLGRGDALLAITRTDLLRHYRRFYSTSNMTLVVAADIPAEEGIARVRETFGGYRGGEKPANELPPVEPLPEPRASFEERDLDGAAYLVIALPGPPANHPDRLLLEVLLAAIGEGRESILHRALVLERGLASSVWAQLYPRAGPSVAAIGVALAPARIRPALAEIRRQLRIAIEGGLSDAFDYALNRRRNEFTFKGERGLAWARRLAEADAIGDSETALRYADRLARLDPREMPAIASRYLDLDRAAIGGLVPRGTPSSDYAVVRASPLLPEVSRDPLPGELAVLAQAIPGAELVGVDIRIRGGSAADPPGRGGLAGFVARLILRGSADLSGPAFARRLEALGVRAEAGAGRDAAFIRFAAPATRFPDALSTVARAIQRPAFLEGSGERDIEAVRREIEGEALFEASRATGIADRIFWGNAFAGTPYEASPLGRSGSIAAIDRASAAAYWGSHYRADRLIVAAAGPMAVRELELLVRLAFRDLPPALDEPGSWPDEPPPFAAPRRLGSPYRPHARNTEQTTIVAAYSLPPADPEGFPRISLLAHILGGSPHTPLWTLREGAGLAYQMAATRIQNRYGGCLQVRAIVPDSGAEAALRAMRSAIEGLRDRGLSEAELERAKRTFLSTWNQASEDPQHCARFMADSFLLGWPAAYAVEFPRLVESVGVEEIGRTIREVLDPQREWIVAVGRDAVRRFGRPPAPPPPAPSPSPEF